MTATPDSTLDDTRRSKADLQRELAELRRTLDECTQQRDEALARETAVTDVLRVINSSAGDLVPVFNAILEKARVVCGFATGTLNVYDGEYFRTVAFYGIEEGFAEILRQPRRTGPQERLLRGERIVQVVDARELSRDDPVHRAAVDIGGVRTVLFVPLRTDNALLGYLTANRREVLPFSEKQIALLENFAAQAVIAMENARLITETREALEQQTATAEVLGVINSSPGDLAPVFDAMLERATRLCEATYGHLFTYDGELLHPVAVHGEPRFADWLRQQGPIKPGGGPMTRALRGEWVVSVADVTQGEVYQSVPSTRELIDRGGIRSGLMVALRKDDKPLGAIVLYRQEVRPFTDKQIALLENFATQAVIAMENARLITETREALDQQTATSEVLQVINSSPGDLAPVFDAILEKAHSFCGAAFGSLLVCDGELFRAVATHNLPDAFATLATQPFRASPNNILSRLLRGEAFVQVADLAEVAAAVPDDPIPHAAVELGGVRTILQVPLRRDGVLTGVITAYRQEVRPFTDNQIVLLQNFAAQAVIAIENARLITETQEALDQQTATAEVLGVINSSPGDLTPVFDAMLEKASRLCEAAFGIMNIWDGERFQRVAMRGLPPEVVDVFREPMVPPPGSLAERFVRGETVVRIPDLSRDEIHLKGPGLQALVRFGARSYAAVALRKEDHFLGSFMVYRTEVRPFSDKQIALLQNFAAQAVIAMENARLITETREALEQQTATSEVLGVINSSPGDLKPVFDAMVERALRLCGADAATVRTFDGELLHLAAAHAEPRMMEQLLQMGPSHLNWLYEPLSRGERVIHIPDVRETEAYRGIAGARERLDLRGIRSWLAVALCKDGALLGVLNVNRRDVWPFTDKQIALLENFAAQAVVAIENARLLGELRQRTEEVAELNRGLEARVADQLAELERTGKLRRFLAPQLADLIIAQGDDSILESHRREIVVVFCDIRGFTAFAERAEPEEVMALLRDYHAALGPIVARFEGTLDHYSGDGVMVFFNDPLPTPEPAKRAIEMAVAMREAAQWILKSWRRHGHDLGFGVGISQGYATLGQIGFAERMDYTAIGTVCNLAARLCDEARDGQILISRRVAVAVEDDAKLEEIGEVSLKGLSQAVAVYNVVQ